MSTGLIIFTRLSVEEVEKRLKTNKLPLVLISENGPDYTEICERYKICYIHSSTDVSYYGLTEETIPVVLNRICMGAAALNVESILIYVNCCESFVLTKSLILDKIAINKNNIAIKYKGKKDLTYKEFFEDLHKL